jgi:DNA-binding PadR family transcriptional regulator
MLALGQGEGHGYAIMRDIDALTGGHVRLGPGTLYRSIQRMVVEGLIQELDERPDPATDDERRRYYRLTAFGQRVAQAEARRLTTLLKAAKARGFLEREGRA